MRQIEKLILLRTIDELWMDHLEEMEYLRDSVGLRAYGQRDPFVEYKTEGHRMFRGFMGAFENQVAGLIFKVGPAPAVARGSVQNERGFTRNDTRADAENTNNQRSSEKIGRNDLCPCGSGKKYKKCHGK